MIQTQLDCTPPDDAKGIPMMNNFQGSATLLGLKFVEYFLMKVTLTTSPERQRRPLSKIALFDRRWDTGYGPPAWVDLNSFGAEPYDRCKPVILGVLGI